MNFGKNNGMSFSQRIQFFERAPQQEISPQAGKKQNLKNSKNDKVGVYKANKDFQPDSGSKCLFLIDPQNDFIVDGGALQVKGALEDSKRAATFIMKNLDSFGNIYVSLDTHMQYHIAHKSFWNKLVLPANDKNVYEWDSAPIHEIKNFEQIPHKAVKGFIYSEDKKEVIKYVTQDKDMREWGKFYTEQLERGSKKNGDLVTLTLTIWPNHCLIGSTGHNVQADILQALQTWEKKNKRAVTYILKGNNSKTEHYSALQAEVPVHGDATTKFNEDLYSALTKHSKIYITGQARSHCVNFSTRDLVGRMIQDKQKTDKVVLLEGSFSDVFMCEAIGEKFVSDMKEKGCQSLDVSGIKPIPEGWKADEKLNKFLATVDNKYTI